MSMNPNEAFLVKKSVPRKINVVLIRCGVCGKKLILERHLWLDQEHEIVCSECGATDNWDII